MVSAPGHSDDQFSNRVYSLAQLIRRVWRIISGNAFTTLSTQSGITLSDASVVRTGWSEQLEVAVLGHVRETYMGGVGIIAEATAADADELIGEDQVQSYLTEVRNRLVSVGDDVWQDVRAQIQLGIKNGESVAEIAQRVKNVSHVSTARALTIARTETHAAFEAGAHAQALFVDPDATKTWLATNDEKTRASHKLADGQKVKINEKFTVGAAQLSFPGDPLGGPGEAIQCRCTVIYDFADSPLDDNPSDASVDTVNGLALVAAGKWKPHEHPRGNDGKFIKKGGISIVLSKKKLTLDDVESAATAVITNPAEWDKLTNEQQSYISEQVKKLPDSFFYSEIKENFKKATTPGLAQSATHTKSGTPPNTVVHVSDLDLSDVDFDAVQVNEIVAESVTTGDYVEKIGDKSYTFYDADGLDIATTLDPLGVPTIIAVNGTDNWKIVTDKFKSTMTNVTSPASTVTPNTSDSVKIPAGLKGKPGDSAKVTTGVIWGKHTAGDVILDTPNGSEQVVWNGKKYDNVVDGKIVASWSKKDAYAKLKGDTHWVVPGGSMTPTEPKLFGADKEDWQKLWNKGLITTEEFEAEFGEKPVGADVPPADTPTLEGIVNGMMQAETQDDWKALQEQAAKLPPPAKTAASPVKNILLEDSEDGFINPSEAIALITMLDADDVSKLSQAQKKNIAAQLENGKYTSTPGYDDAQKKWGALLATDAVSTTTAQSAIPGKPMDVSDFLDVLEQSDSLKSGDIIAVSPDGKYKMTWSAISDGFLINEKASHGEWIDVDGYAFDGSMGDDNVDIIDSMLTNFESDGITWVAPKSTVNADVDAVQPTAPVYTAADKIGYWGSVLSPKVKHSPGDVVALTTNGKYKVTATTKPGFFDVKFIYPDGQEQQVMIVAHDLPGVDIKLFDFGEWVTPPKKMPSQSALADSPGVSPSIESIYAAAGVLGELGDVLAFGTYDPTPGKKFRLLVSKNSKGEKTVALQAEQSPGFWVNMGAFTSAQAFGDIWAKTAFKWNWANEKVDPNDVHGPSVPKDGPTPGVPPVATPTPPTTPQVNTTPPPSVSNGDDISGIPAYVKSQFKYKFKSANVGYWSKPEKIWDVVKDIQQTYTNPSSPGNSTYTPSQILKSLDSLTKTKTPNPYSDKIAKWAATAKGSKYVGGAGVGNPLLAQPAKAPEQVAEEVWNAAGSLPFEKPVFTAVGAQNIKWQIINNTPTGKDSKSFTLQAQGGDGSWYGYKDLNTLKDLQTAVVNYDMKPTQASGQPLPETSLPSQTAPTTSPPADLQGDVANILDGNPPKSDISGISEQHKQIVYSEFKKQPSTYLDSPDKDIFIALKHISSNNGLSLLQALKVIDDVGAKKVGKPNAFLFEQKIKKWLQTPQGAAVALGQPVPKPPRPQFKAGVSTAGIPSEAASNNYTYSTISNAQATAEWKKIIAKHGDWTASEQKGLKSYTGGIYYSINGYLYGEYDSISPTNETAMVNAQKGMRPSTSPMLLHRGVGFDGVADSLNHADLEKKVGQVWRSDGFSSTSVGGTAAFSGKPVIMEIEAPPGTPMAWLKPISKFTSENEMLLAAGINYKILSVKKSGGHSVVRVRVVPDGETS